MNYVAGDQVTDQVSAQVAMVLEALGNDGLSATKLMESMGFLERSSFRKSYLKPALDSSPVERIIPEKPNSMLQKYRRAR